MPSILRLDRETLLPFPWQETGDHLAQLQAAVCGSIELLWHWPTPEGGIDLYGNDEATLHFEAAIHGPDEDAIAQWRVQAMIVPEQLLFLGPMVLVGATSEGNSRALTPHELARVQLARWDSEPVLHLQVRGDPPTTPFVEEG